MDLESLMRLSGGGGGGNQPGYDIPLVDTSEMVYISSLALLKVRDTMRMRSPNTHAHGPLDAQARYVSMQGCTHTPHSVFGLRAQAGQGCRWR